MRWQNKGKRNCTNYNYWCDNIEASDIDTLILGVPFIKVNNTLIEWELVNLSMQQLLIIS